MGITSKSHSNCFLRSILHLILGIGLCSLALVLLLYIKDALSSEDLDHMGPCPSLLVSYNFRRVFLEGFACSWMLRIGTMFREMPFVAFSY